MGSDKTTETLANLTSRVLYVRLPVDLYEQLAEEARRDDRSLSQQVRKIMRERYQTERIASGR